VTLVLWVGEVLGAGRPWAPAAVSGILVADGAAFALAGPLAGILVDRWDRRLVMMRTEAVRAVLAAGLAVMTFVPAGALPVWAWLAVTYADVFCLAAAGQLFSPAMLAVTRDVVRGEAERARAAGLAGAATSGAGMIGPPAAAPLLFAAGPHWALAADAVSYVVSLLAVRSVRLPGRAAPGRPRAAGVAAGLRAEFSAGIGVFRSGYLAALLRVTMICQVGTAAVSALNLFFLTSDLHAPARLYGLAEMAMGGGFIVGSLAAGRAVRRFGTRTLTWSGLVATGILAVTYALQRDLPAGIPVFAGYGAAIGLLNAASGPRLLDAAPGEYLGRVMAVYRSANQITSATSAILWAWLASTVLRSVRGSVLGVSFNSASLILVIAGTVIIASGLWALAVLPADPGPAAGPQGGRRISSRRQPVSAAPPAPARPSQPPARPSQPPAWPPAAAPDNGAAYEQIRAHDDRTAAILAANGGEPGEDRDWPGPAAA
jgi:MFS family permease